MEAAGSRLQNKSQEEGGQFKGQNSKNANLLKHRSIIYEDKYGVGKTPTKHFKRGLKSRKEIWFWMRRRRRQTGESQGRGGGLRGVASVTRHQQVRVTLTCIHAYMGQNDRIDVCMYVCGWKFSVCEICTFRVTFCQFSW